MRCCPLRSSGVRGRSRLAPVNYGALVPKRPSEVQAFTVRLPAGEYHLLRALSFQHASSLNDLVIFAIRRLIDDNDRPALQALLERAQQSRRGRGLSSQLPTNPAGRGPKPRGR